MFRLTILFFVLLAIVPVGRFWRVSSVGELVIYTFMPKDGTCYIQPVSAQD